jgi:hypothetical protein
VRTLPNKSCLAELVSIVEHFEKLDDAEELAELMRHFPTPRDAVAYIMDTFPVVRRKDEEKYNGDYRTKRVLLEIYDEMAEAMRTGFPNQSRLGPPPGPPKSGLPEWKPGQPKPKDWPSHIHAPKEVER